MDARVVAYEQERPHVGVDESHQVEQLQHARGLPHPPTKPLDDVRLGVAPLETDELELDPVVRRLGELVRFIVAEINEPDPARSVVNEWGRSHDVKNLFIVDGSVFVTSGGVNPTSTIQALALYIADSIKQRLANLFD